MYQPESIGVKFVKGFVVYIAVYTLLSSLAGTRINVQSMLFMATLIAGGLAYLSRPVHLVIRFTNRQSLIAELKRAVPKRYAVVEENEKVIVFRPTSFWGIMEDLFVVKIDVENSATLIGESRLVKNIRKRLAKTGVIQEMPVVRN